MTYDDTGKFIGQLCTPFTFHYNHIDRLLLINFEQDPDEVYIGFEPQMLNDPQKGAGLLVIGWRHDGTIDVYHQPQLTLQREDYDIVGNGLSEFFVCPFDGAQFDISEQGVNLHLEFTDRQGRSILLKIHERDPRRRKPFGLLAPFPANARNSPSMPIPLLYDFYFVRRAGTDITIQIAGKTHQPDMLPAPIDGRRVYFTRYSPDPFIVLFNQAYNGTLLMQPFVEGDNTTQVGAIYEIRTRDSYPEIAAIRTAPSQRHQVRLTFTPAFPDLLHLKSGTVITGSWHMDLEKATGFIAGTYRVQRSNDQIKIELHPGEGWQPRINKLSVWFMFRVVPMFKQWPKNYRYYATIDLSQPDTPHLSSHWQKSE